MSGAGQLYQLQLFGPFDRVQSPVNVQLAIDALGVRANGADGNGQFSGNVASRQAGRQKPQHLQLALAEGVNQRLWGRFGRRCGERRQQSARVPGRDATGCRLPQQFRPV